VADFRQKFTEATTVDDIAADPHAFGAPTFEEFKKNHGKYSASNDATLAIVDKGSNNLNRVVDKYIYEIEGFRCKNLEEVERIAGDYGIPIRDLDYRPELIPQGGGKAKMLIKFVSKHDRERRQQWE